MGKVTVKSLQAKISRLEKEKAQALNDMGSAQLNALSDAEKQRFHAVLLDFAGRIDDPRLTDSMVLSGSCNFIEGAGEQHCVVNISIRSLRLVLRAIRAHIGLI
jgi:hypothetical protein